MREGWTYKKLGDVCESELGKTLNSAKDKGELHPYLCAVNVLWDKIDISSLKETKFEDSELERYSVKQGDLLVCEGGDIGRAAIWDKDYPIQYQNALHRLRFSENMLPRFCLMYLMNLKEKGDLDAKYGKGVTIKHLVKSSLLSIPIPVPPLSEQERIVSELDLLSSIIEKKKAQLKEYDKLAQSIFYDMFGDPVTNEKGWEVTKLNSIYKVTSSKRILQEEWKKEGVPFYKVADIVSLIHSEKVIPSAFISDSTYGNLLQHGQVPSVGDILVTSRGTLGQCYIVKAEDKFYFQDGMITWLSQKEKCILPIYLKMLFSSDSFLNSIEQMANSSTIAYISINQLSKKIIPLPPLSLQQSFASKIEAIERQKALVQQSIVETQTMFDYTMDKYFG